MEKIIDGVIAIVFTLVIAKGGQLTIQKIYNWSQKAAHQKTIQGFGSLEKSTRQMTGGKLDF